MENFKEQVIKAVEEATNLSVKSIEIPPDQKMGDFALPCFQFAKQLKKAPNQIAEDLAREIPLGLLIEKIEVKGPYLNIFLNSDTISEKILNEIHSKADNYGTKPETKKKVLVESPSPNTNKPLHLGHLRNMLLGMTLHKLMKTQGKDSHVIEVVNDRGVHICKSMLAYKLFGEGKTPESEGRKSDHFVGDYYVKFDQENQKNPELEKQAQEMLVKWEEGDPETIELWKKMNGWALGGMKETYDKVEFPLEKQYFESDIYKIGKEIAEKGLTDGIFKKDENGSIIVDLEDKKLGTKVLLRPDGTAIYITQDLQLAKARHDEWNFDEMIYVVGNEQKYHFQVLFEIFKLLKYDFAENCKHFAYGMIELPEGKMKSREGTVVDTDNLINDVLEIAKKETSERYDDITDEELEKRAHAIAMSAIRFFILKYDPLKDFVYNPKESLRFDGETGPYVQYTHARLASILRKAAVFEEAEPRSTPKFKTLREEETKRIIKLLADYPKVLETATEKLNPSHLTRYLLDLCQATNEFYHKYKILSEDEPFKSTRLYLIESIKQVIKNALTVLHIEPLERM